MEARLKTALQTTIGDYYSVEREISDPSTNPDRKLQLIAVKAALVQVLQHFAGAEYVECVNGQWRIKVIVVMERG